MSFKSTIMKIALISILLNFAAGIMISALPEIGNDPSLRGGINYQQNYTINFENEFKNNISPSSNLVDQGDADVRFLDLLGTGKNERLYNGINKFLFGAITIFQGLFPTGTEVLFTGLKSLLTIGYIFVGVWFFTGKEVDR